MTTKDLALEGDTKSGSFPEEKKEMVQQDAEGKTVKKRKRKHNSALSAAAQAASPVDQANARSAGDAGFGSTGTNLTYKEKDGIL